jgi:putative two-component system response regulator
MGGNLYRSTVQGGDPRTAILEALVPRLGDDVLGEPDEATLREASILAIDDEVSNLELLRMVLARAGYSRVRTASDPREVAGLLDQEPVDLILLDLHMPHVDGFQLLRTLKQEDRDHDRLRPILVLTADATTEARHRALSEGADDFLTKPFDIVDVHLRVRNALARQQLHRRVREDRELLEVRVRERTRDLEAAHIETLERLAAAAEYRDDETGQHTKRVGAMAGRIGTALGLDTDFVEMVGRAAALHDVGKIGVPDAILLRPGSLTAGEFAVVRTHTAIGSRILSGSRSPLLQLAEEVALAHHERWDGTGYHGMAGTETPLAARITTLADAFDAMTNHRPYRAALPFELVMDEITGGRGTQFDPDVVDAFLGLGIQAASSGASA